MADEAWLPVHVSEKNPVNEERGIVTIEWKLAGGWSREWAQVFTPAGGKSGSGAFVNDPTPPAARSDATIVWAVPAGDLRGANAYVESSIEATNQAYRVARQAEIARNQAEKDAAKARADRLTELKKELDDLS